jgi:hypothetical protein
LGGILNSEKLDITGEQRGFAPGGYNKIFKLNSKRSLKGLIEGGDLDEYLPYNMRLEANGANDDAFDSTEAYDYLADRIRNGESVLPYAVEEELRALQYEGNAVADVADELTEDEINGQLQQASNEERESATDARIFDTDSENGGARSSERAESATETNTDQQAQVAPESKQDLLGDDTAAKQALADAERAKDTKRNSGNDNQDTFTLTGSTSEADQAAAAGAQDLFAAPKAETRPEAKSQEATDAIEAIKASDDISTADKIKLAADVRKGNVTIDDVESVVGKTEPAANENAPTKSNVDDFGEKLEGARKDMVRAMAKEYSDDDIASLPLSKLWPASDVNLIENKLAAAISHTAREMIPSKPRKSYAVKTWVEKVKILRNIGKLVSDAAERDASSLLEKIKVAELGHFKSKVALLEAIERDSWKRIGNVEEYPNAYSYVDGVKQSNPLVRVDIDGRTNSFNASSVADVIEQVNEKLGVAVQDRRMAFEVRGSKGTFFINKKGDKNYTKLKMFDSSKDAFDFIKNNYDEVLTAWEATKDRLNVKESDVRGKVNRPRTGEDYRDGKDVTTEQFATTFGFRGVQFGEWVKQGGKDNDRQGALNAAYDALMDLANIVGVPPKALSLEGTLGLSFGARGHGKAAAHFEPSMLVINLTKTQGAGTLAHEWFHALDNYFSRKRGGEKTMAEVKNSQLGYREANYITYKPEPLYINKNYGNKGITKAELSRYRALSPNSKYWSEENWILDPKHPEGVRPEVEQHFADLVEALNTSPMKARAVNVDGVKEGTDGYWSRIIERAARSFENYVINKMQLNGYDNDYLANVVKIESFNRDSSRFPYLLDEEVAPVAEAFDNLFSTIETKETDSGNVAMFSRGNSMARTPFISQQDEGYIPALNKVIDLFKSGDRAKQQEAGKTPVPISRTPVVLRQVMEDDGSKPFKRSDFVVGQGSTLYLKANNIHSRSIHSGAIDKSVLDRLPQLIADPIAVFKSSASSGDSKSFKVLVDAKDVNGNPVIIAIKPSVAMQQLNGALVNLQATIFPTTWDDVNRWNKSGDLRYYNEKSPAVGGFELPLSSVAASNPREAAANADTKEGFNANIGVSASKVKVVTKGDIEVMPEDAYSRSKTNATAYRGMDKDKAQSIVDELQKSHKGLPKVNLVDHHSKLPIPSSLVEEINGNEQLLIERLELVTQLPSEQNIQAALSMRINDVEGMYSNGEIWINTNAINSESRLREVFAHEAIGHMSVESMLNEVDKTLFPKLITQVKTLNKTGNKYIRGIWNDVKESQPDIDDTAMAGEVLAFIAERGHQDIEMTPVARSIWQRLIDGIKAFAKLVFNVEMTDVDVRDIVSMASRYAKGEDVVSLISNKNMYYSRNSRIPSKESGDIKETDGSNDQVNTPQFKAWFGDSKVVDADGKPLIVYHGGNTDISTFTKSSRGYLGAAYFTDNRDVSSHYAMFGAVDYDSIGDVEDAVDTASTNKLTKERNGVVTPVYLLIKNPFDPSNVSVIDVIDSLGKDFVKSLVKDDSSILMMEESDNFDGFESIDDWLNNNLKDYIEENYSDIDLPYDGDSLGDATAGFRFLHTSNTINDYAEANNYDGIIYQDQESGGTTYVPFKNTQIKSAIGNNGDFNPNNPDIRFSRSNSQQSLTPEWNAPEASKLDSIVYTLQDKHVDLKRVTQAIKAAGTEILDRWNAYLQEELFHGRTAKRVQDFIKHYLDPLITDMRMRGVKMADFEEYLWARHAEERNIQIAKINPDMPDSGSGMSTQDARDYLANLSPADKTKHEALAKRIDLINKKSRQVLMDYGLESADTIAAWEGAYKNYVPLMREDMDAGFGTGTGQGFSVKGNASKRATGSNRAVVDIIANIAQQYEKNVIRGEKNRVSTALIGLAQLNPNDKFWKVDTPPTMKIINKSTGLVEVRTDPNYKTRDNVVVARIVNKAGDIEERSVVFNEFDERAMRMSASIKNLDQDQIGELLGTASAFTRYFASINTQYNPIFGVVNIIRDIQGALLNLSTTPIADKKIEVLKNTPGALIGVYQDLRTERKTGKKANNEWSALFDEFQNEGGQTGFRDMYRNAKERGEALKDALDPTWWKDSKIGKVISLNGSIANQEQWIYDKAIKPIFDWLEDYNSALENAVRLSVYKVALDNGHSKQQAASMAKNISVNFNRKGEMGRQIGSLYAFFNASVQGTARIGETMLNRDASGKINLSTMGKRVIQGGLLLGAMQALMLAAAGYDDDEPPEFVKDRSLIIPIGDGKFITIPMPLGYNAIPSMGRIVAEWALSGGENTQKRLIHIVDMLLDVTNPIGNAGLSLQTITPTVIDPLSALAENKDFTGNAISREDMSSLNPTPGFTRSRDKAWDFSVAIARGINWVTGGTDVKQGAISPTADQLEYLAGQFTGGVGREVIKAGTTADSMVTGEELPTYKIPLVGRFYGDSTGQSSQGAAFYNNVRSLNEHQAEIKNIKEAGGNFAKYITENPDAALYKTGDLALRQINSLRKRQRLLKENDADKESVKAIDERITAIMTKLNDRVKLAKEKEAA